MTASSENEAGVVQSRPQPQSVWAMVLRRERRAGDLVFAAAFFVFALTIAAFLPSQAKFLGNKSLVAEPGFWPLVGTVMMVLCGGFHFASNLVSPRVAGRLAEVLLWGRSVEFVLWFTVYVLAVPKIGYLPATVLFALMLSFRLGYRSVKWMVGAAGFAVGVVLVFKTGLGVKLPAGEIYQYLPDSIRSFVMVNF